MTVGAEDELAQAPKEDPEKLVLRARPRPVVRFRKGLLIGIAASLCTAVAALTWFALEPQGFRIALEDEEPRPFKQPGDEALKNAPADYSKIPKLGPPLPGDLGRPILEHQRSLASEPASLASESKRADAALAAREAAAAAEQMARSSGLLAKISDLPRQPPAGEGAQRSDPADDKGARPANSDRDEMREPFTLVAGTIIPASLITGLNSDVPGRVLAQVTQNVFDSVTGRTTLIPQGARLLGRYDSDVSYGQRRAHVVWERIIFPNGASIDLSKTPATDTAGYAGLTGRVDTHPWQLAKGVLLSTLLGVGAELSLEGAGPIARAIRQSGLQSSTRAGEQLVGRALDIKPTLIVPPGSPVRALLEQDLNLEPWTG